METRIKLTEKQITVIEKYFDGKISMFGTEEEDMETMKTVITMAENLQEELDAYDESGDDLIEWFWGKYKSQEPEN